MKPKLALAALAALAAGAAAFAPPSVAKSPVQPQGKAAKQCFYSRNVESFAAPDENTVNIRVSIKDYYQLQMFAPCHDVDWNQSIALISRGSSWICTGNGLDAEIVSHSPIGPQKCQVKGIRKLTPAEVAALPKHGKP
jgi:hypothetical protein